jgi:hypothetical protein
VGEVLGRTEVAVVAQQYARFEKVADRVGDVVGVGRPPATNALLL